MDFWRFNVSTYRIMAVFKKTLDSSVFNLYNTIKWHIRHRIKNDLSDNVLRELHEPPGNKCQ